MSPGARSVWKWGRATLHRDAEDRHEATDPVRARGAGHDRHAERHEHAAAEALDDAGADEHLDVRREGAQGRAEREEGDGHQVQTLGAEAVGGPAGERDDAREGEGVGRDGPRDGGVGERGVPGRQVGLEVGEGDVDDGDVEDRHDRAEDDDAGDLQHGGVDLLRVLLEEVRVVSGSRHRCLQVGEGGTGCGADGTGCAPEMCARVMQLCALSAVGANPIRVAG